MKIGDTVRVRGYSQTAKVTGVYTFPDPSRKQMCDLDRTLRAHRLAYRTWPESELELVRASPNTGEKS